MAGIGDVKLLLILDIEIDWLECYLDFLCLYLSKRVLLLIELQNIIGENLRESMISLIVKILSWWSMVYLVSRIIQRLEIQKRDRKLGVVSM